MKISIITPVYNAEKTVERTILSVINQKLDSEIEYIIVDGCSNDGTASIINQYLDKISVFISEPDQGVYDAMNKGISCATGDIIGIINADDWYNDGALKVVEHSFSQNPDTSILYSPIDNYLNGEYLNTFIPGDLDNLIFKFTLNHPSCFVKKSVYEELGKFDLSYTIAADYDFILRAYDSECKFKYVASSTLASYSLNGMSGKLMSKFAQIRESWIVGNQIIHNYPKTQQRKRNRFYFTWLTKEILLLPIKYFIDATTIKKIKGNLRLFFPSLSSEQYGSW